MVDKFLLKLTFFNFYALFLVKKISIGDNFFPSYSQICVVSLSCSHNHFFRYRLVVIPNRSLVLEQLLMSIIYVFNPNDRFGIIFPLSVLLGDISLAKKKCCKLRSKKRMMKKNVRNNYLYLTFFSYF